MGDGSAKSGVADEAFARGDFRQARRLARATLDDDAADDAARASARTILERTGIDPFIGWMTGACLAFFLLVVVLGLR